MKSRGTIELGDVTVHNVKQLKRLNQAIFPVIYNDKFYKDVLLFGELVKLAYFNDIIVGAVCSREEKVNGQKRLYIMTLGCLAPYRRLGIGRAMLQHLLQLCEEDGSFDNVYLHVQVSNADAIAFYEHFGFRIIERKESYYKRIEPADAFVLQKNLKPVPETGDVPETGTVSLETSTVPSETDTVPQEIGTVECSDTAVVPPSQSGTTAE